MKDIASQWTGGDWAVYCMRCYKERWASFYHTQTFVTYLFLLVPLQKKKGEGHKRRGREESERRW